MGRKLDGSSSCSWRAIFWPAACLACVVHGSLLPYDFDRAAVASSFDELIGRLGLVRPTSDDLTTNLLVYLPIGISVFAFLRARGRGGFDAFLLTLGIGIGTSLACECIQTALRSRVASWTDVILNGIGCGVGAILAPGISGFLRRMAAQIGAELRQSPAALAASLLTVGLFMFHLFPFDWVTDTQGLHAAFARARFGGAATIALRGGADSIGVLAGKLGASIWFAALGYLAGLAASQSGAHPFRAFARAVRDGAVLAFVIETMQLFTRSHILDTASLQLNVFGAAFGAWAGVFVIRPDESEPRRSFDRPLVPTPVLVLLACFQVGLLLVTHLPWRGWTTATLMPAGISWRPFESWWRQPMLSAASDALSMFFTQAALAVTIFAVLVQTRPRLGSVIEPPLPGRERVGVRVEFERITPHPTSPLKGRGVFRHGPASAATMTLVVATATLTALVQAGLQNRSLDLTPILVSAATSWLTVRAFQECRPPYQGRRQGVPYARAMPSRRDERESFRRFRPF